MAKTYNAVYSVKGGCGKTAVSIFLAYYLAQKIQEQKNKPEENSKQKDTEQNNTVEKNPEQNGTEDNNLVESNPEQKNIEQKDTEQKNGEQKNINNETVKKVCLVDTDILGSSMLNTFIQVNDEKELTEARLKDLVSNHKFINDIVNADQRVPADYSKYLFGVSSKVCWYARSR